MIEEEVPETVQGDPEISLEDRGGMIEDDDPETVQDDENGSLEDREVPVVSTTLRPAGFGWQATRNRILGEGVSPEALAKGDRPHRFCCTRTLSSHKLRSCITSTFWRV